MDVAGNIPGLPGLFLAALVSAALSTMSGGLNAAAGTIWEDFVSPWIPESDTKQQTATRVMKGIVVVLGVICVSLVYVVEHLGEIFTISTSMHGVTAGTITGLFILGMLVPWATYKGAVIGGVMGFMTSVFIIVGAQVHKLNGTFRAETLPTTTDNCPYPLNMTDWTPATRPPIPDDDKPMILFTVSFLYYSLVGVIAVVSCGTIASFLTGASDLNTLNRDHFSPVVHRYSLTFLFNEEVTFVLYYLWVFIKVPSAREVHRSATEDDVDERSGEGKRSLVKCSPGKFVNRFGKKTNKILKNSLILFSLTFI